MSTNCYHYLGHRFLVFLYSSLCCCLISTTKSGGTCLHIAFKISKLNGHSRAKGFARQGFCWSYRSIHVISYLGYFERLTIKVVPLKSTKRAGYMHWNTTRWPDVSRDVSALSVILVRNRLR